MPFTLLFTTQAKSNLKELENNPALHKRYKAACKALGYLQGNPRHPGLQTHKFSSLTGEHGEEVFEAYAENRTPGAYRIFWHYGPGKSIITVIAVTPHP